MVQFIPSNIDSSERPVSITTVWSCLVPTLTALLRSDQCGVSQTSLEHLYCTDDHPNSRCAYIGVRKVYLGKSDPVAVTMSDSFHVIAPSACFFML